MKELIFKSREHILLCPLCEGDYLHHTKVETFERDEDSMEGIHTVIIGEQVDVKYDGMKGNPSIRRSGLKIEFYCELCQKELPSLVLSQHKGQTIMGWSV